MSRDKLLIRLLVLLLLIDSAAIVALIYDYPNNDSTLSAFLT